ncbi:hypothetical protein L1987_38258 [Smallanthus sonchifolius]|uniref:Uncharacterized protein n=1 Tax=Smallanthus sonchifolius TaxID=185202 RepID=A0ACB9HJ01_9ASTR|nr:hypothetical protein L1987_38258 [Smallanthus sonchifolius]
MNVSGIRDSLRPKRPKSSMIPNPTLGRAKSSHLAIGNWDAKQSRLRTILGRRLGGGGAPQTPDELLELAQCLSLLYQTQIPGGNDS